MSIRLHPQDVIQAPSDEIDSGPELSSSDEDEDQNDPKTWDDWVSDSPENRECYSLFEDKKLSSVARAVEYDEETHGFNLNKISSKLGEFTLPPIRSPIVGPTEVEDILRQLSTFTSAPNSSTTFASRWSSPRCEKAT